MGRPPSGGAPAFRFLPSEVAEMEARLHQLHNTVPGRAVLQSLADKFSASPERAGRVAIQPKQVWNWFQNRRYSHRAKNIRPAPQPPSKMTPTGADRLQHATAPSAFRAAQNPAAAGAHPGSSPSAGKSGTEGAPVEFEAKSARDGAWYDVAAFLSHRMFESGDPELYRATHWLQFWSQLEKHEEDQVLIKDACRRMETAAMQIFVDHGWRFSNRICN